MRDEIDPRDLRTWRRSRAVRLPASLYGPERPVHVVCRARRRSAPFGKPGLAAMVLGFVAADSATLAACVMPDHVHWLIVRSDDLVSRVRRFKSVTTVLSRPFGWRGALWQRSFYDRLVRSEENLLTVARYVFHNPERSVRIGDGEPYPYRVLWKSRRG